MGMGHGLKKLAKMFFAPRLPQDWRRGCIAGQSAASHMTHCIAINSHDPESIPVPIAEYRRETAPVLHPGQDLHLANHRQLCQEAGEAIRDKVEANQR